VSEGIDILSDHIEWRGYSSEGMDEPSQYLRAVGVAYMVNNGAEALFNSTRRLFTAAKAETSPRNKGEQ
jgi:hypothetical protein